MQDEKGLMWTAHPRIKGSTGYPDKHKDTAFFKSDRFLGGAWKNMPADYSLPRLVTRVLDTLDDMNNWAEKPSERKRSEEHTSELQSLMRISYAVFCLKKKKHNRTTS